MTARKKSTTRKPIKRQPQTEPNQPAKFSSSVGESIDLCLAASGHAPNLIVWPFAETPLVMAAKARNLAHGYDAKNGDPIMRIMAWRLATELASIAAMTVDVSHASRNTTGHILKQLN